MDWGLERGFREVQRVGEGSEGEIERWVIDDDDEMRI